MSRLLFLSTLAACLLCSCASGRSHLDNRVVQTTSRHRLSGDDATRDIVYVRVAGGAPDAVLYAESDKWADVVALLEFGQRLMVIDRPRGDYVEVRTIGHDVDIEGWVWYAAVQYSVPRGYPPGEDVWEDEGAGLDPATGRVERRAMPRAIESVDEHERALADLAGDSELLLRRFHEFGKSGGLTGD